jgi:uncharacterized protein DUF559
MKSLSCGCMREHRTSNPPSQSHDAACVEHQPRLSVSTSPSLRGVDRGERQQQTASKTRRYLKWIVVDRARLLRKKATEPERILWRHQRNRNFDACKFPPRIWLLLIIETTHCITLIEIALSCTRQGYASSVHFLCPLGPCCGWNAG